MTSGSHGKKPVRKRNPARTGSLSARKALVVGLTGGTATGKTTVARMFEKLGASMLSADEVVHQLLRPRTDVWHAVVREFGESILNPDGEIDRGKLADIVFSDAERRRRLESITHPPVLEYFACEAERFRSSEQGVLVLEIPLLVETSSVGMVDKVLVVTAEQETQIERLQKRYGVTPEQAIARIESQLPMSEKEKYADWVVSTEGTLQSTEEHVAGVWSIIQDSLAQPL